MRRPEKWKIENPEAKAQPQGRLIALCGIDGTGKTLQAAILKERAVALGRRVETMDFPCYKKFFGRLAARYLRGEFGEEAGEVSPYLAALPFACDRWQAAPVLRAWLEEAALVICNRYVPANLAHQGAKIASDEERRPFLKWVEELEYDVLGLPRPDLHVLLDMPATLAGSLIERKEEREYLKNGRDIHESDAAYLAATREVYVQLAEETPNWLRVDCAPCGALLAPEEIAEQVWEGVRLVIEP